MLRQVCLYAFYQFTAGKQNTMLTTFAFQTNIRAEADHYPFVRAAWMRFFQTQMVIQLQIRKHGQDYTAMPLKTRVRSDSQYEKLYPQIAIFSASLQNLQMDKSHIENCCCV